MSWVSWTYQPDYYPTGGGLFKTGADSNFGGYNNGTMNHLIAESYQPGTPADTLAALYRYEEFAAQHLPVLFMPFPAVGPMPAPIAYNRHLRGVLSSYDPVSNLYFPNYWTYAR
jgi:peptide/nickel transport system substrate-binding protein